MAVDVDLLLAGASVLWAQSGVGADAAFSCSVLYGVYRAFGGAILDGSWRIVEGESAGWELRLGPGQAIRHPQMPVGSSTNLCAP